MPVGQAVLVGQPGGADQSLQRRELATGIARHPPDGVAEPGARDFPERLRRVTLDFERVVGKPGLERGPRFSHGRPDGRGDAGMRRRLGERGATRPIPQVRGDRLAAVERVQLAQDERRELARKPDSGQLRQGLFEPLAIDDQVRLAADGETQLTVLERPARHDAARQGGREPADRVHRHRLADVRGAHDLVPQIRARAGEVLARDDVERPRPRHLAAPPQPLRDERRDGRAA